MFSKRCKTPVIWNILVSYVAAISSNAAVFCVLLIIHRLVKGYEAGPNSAFGNRLAHAAEGMRFILILMWVLALVVDIVPFGVGMLLAARLKSYRYSYFIIGWMALGVILAMLIAFVSGLWLGVEGDPNTYISRQFNEILPLAVISGAFAGWVCRRILEIPENKK